MTEDYKLDLPYMLVTFMGQLQAALHCPDTALTTGLRLMVLLLSGGTLVTMGEGRGKLWRVFIPAMEGSSQK